MWSLASAHRRPLSGSVEHALLVASILFMVPVGAFAQTGPVRQLPVEESGVDLQGSIERPVHFQPVSERRDAITSSDTGRAAEMPLFSQPVTDSKEPLTIWGGVVGVLGAPFRPLAGESPDVEPLGLAVQSSKGSASAVLGPVGIDDHFAVPNDQSLTVAAAGFLDNDIDLDGEALTAVSIQDNVDDGILAAFADGSFTYVPNVGFVGADSFAYVMRDASFSLSDPVTVFIDVLPPANRTPLGTADAFTVLRSKTLTIALPGFLANDIDLDGETLTGVSVADNVDHGILAAFADGSFIYTPNTDFAGPDSFAYRMRDDAFNISDPVTASIEVFAGNRVPIGVEDAFATVINTALVIAAPGFIGNDYDFDGEAITAVSIADNVSNGILAAFADGSFNYQPSPGFFGTDSFAYRMRDASLNFSDPVTVTIQVMLGGATPVGINDEYVVANDDTLSVAAPGFLTNDIDLNGQPLTAVSILDNADHGSLAAFADGSFIYIPNGGYVGPDRFAYRMRDASFNLSDSVFVGIEVLPRANRDPIGTPDAYTALAGTSLSIASPGFLSNDIDLDGEVLTAVSIADNVDNGILAAFADGSFTYIPNAGFVGIDNFTYRMRDERNNFSDPIPVTITVFEGNRGPIGLEDEYAVLLNTARNIASPGFLMNDFDLDGEAVSGVSIDDAVDNGELTAFANGSFNYTPGLGFTGLDHFAYRMADESDNFSDPIPVTLRVIDPNEPELSVEIVSFVGVEDHGTIVLTWSTASETNNAGFEVEHRTPPSCQSDGSSCLDSGWEIVGYVEGAGTTSERRSYSFVVDDPGPGNHAFRLRQLDVDGAFSLSSEIQVLRGMEGPAEISQAYPNPFGRMTRIELVVSKDQDVRAELFDVAGRRIETLLDRRLKAYDKTLLNLRRGNLADGAYFVRIVGENFTATRRAVLIR